MKKFLSTALSIIIVLSGFGVLPASAFAADNGVWVQFCVCDGGVFTLKPQDLYVTADLSDSYKDAVGINDSSPEPTLLDAVIAAHIAAFGEDFMDYAPLKASSASSISSSFGEDTNALSYRINGSMGSSKGWYNLFSNVKNGDYAEYMFYQDAYSYSDMYTSFNLRSADVSVGGTVSLTLTAEVYDSSYNAVKLPAAGVEITVDGVAAGITDQNGRITLKLNNIKEYSVSAQGCFDNKNIFLPYCKVNVSSRLYDYVNTQRTASANMLITSSSAFSADNAMDFLTYLNSGRDMTAYYSSFCQSVKDNLDANGGKLLINDNGALAESVGLYGGVILSLDKIGLNPKAFNGYDITSAFKNMDITTGNTESPYFCRIGIEAAVKSGETELAKSIADKMLTHYTMGKGFNYWGYSCDNTAAAAAALAPIKDEYSALIDDALAVLASYRTDKGYFSDTVYCSYANSDSTAMALMAFCAIQNSALAIDAYTMLTTYYESRTGAFNYTDEYSDYSTKNCLLGLNFFSQLVRSQSLEYSGHIYTSWITDKSPSCTENGSMHRACKLCGDVQTQAIAKTDHAFANGACSVCGAADPSYTPPVQSVTIKSVKLSTSTYTYNGKVKKPSVKVVDSNGNTVSSSNYTVTYAKGRKNVGKYSVKVKFKGNFSGSKTLYFKINPKSTSLSSVKAGKKKLTVKWKKQTTQTTGYQVQYSTSKKFTGAKTTTVSKNKTTSKTISKLKGKKKYYVRVRTYKTVGKTKYYSSWSKAKSVTTKK